MQMLHEAIDTYINETHERQHHGVATACSTRNISQSLKMCKRYLPDSPLDEFGLEEVCRCLETLASRPVSQATRRRISPRTAENAMKAFRRFCRWLSENEQVKWTQPVDSLPRIRVARGEMPGRHQEPINIQQLATVTQQLDSLGKLIMGLSVNCAMSPIDLATAEIGDFRPPAEGELRWCPRRQKHQHYAHSILLWTEVADLVRWGIRRARELNSERLIVSNNGSSWYTEAGNNPTARCSRWWRKARTNNGGFLDIGQSLANNQGEEVGYRLNDLRRVLPFHLECHHDGVITTFILGHQIPVNQAEVLDMLVVQSRADCAIKDLESEFRPFLDALRI